MFLCSLRNSQGMSGISTSWFNAAFKSESDLKPHSHEYNFPFLWDLRTNPQDEHRWLRYAQDCKTTWTPSSSHLDCNLSRINVLVQWDINLDLLFLYPMFQMDSKFIFFIPHNGIWLIDQLMKFFRSSCFRLNLSLPFLHFDNAVIIESSDFPWAFVLGGVKPLLNVTTSSFPWSHPIILPSFTASTSFSHLKLMYVGVIKKLVFNFQSLNFLLCLCSFIGILIWPNEIPSAFSLMK